jgi:ABC-type antimicrobial peptide transport system permease subunit
MKPHMSFIATFCEMSGPSENLRAFLFVYFTFFGSFFLTILTAAALYAPEEVFKSTFHIAAFVTLVVISIVIGLAGVIAEYFSRRQINKKKKNRVMERHD